MNVGVNKIQYNKESYTHWCVSCTAVLKNKYWSFREAKLPAMNIIIFKGLLVTLKKKPGYRTMM